MDSKTASDIVLFQIDRQTINLFKDFLIILEEFRADNLIGEEYFQRLRKRVLGKSNDGLRELHDFLDNFDIAFKRKE